MTFDRVSVTAPSASHPRRDLLTFRAQRGPAYAACEVTREALDSCRDDVLREVERRLDGTLAATA